MSVRKASDQLARSIDRRTGELEHLVQFAVVLATDPLAAEPTDEREVLREDDLQLIQSVRLYDDSPGIAEGDTLVVYEREGTWIVLGVISDQEIPTAEASEPGAALTPSDASTVDATYGTQERDVIENLRTRVNELESRLIDAEVIAE
jgi:hypothetical protein